MSESIIDSLFIELGFKDAGAKKGVDDLDKSLESTRKASKTTAEALEKNGAQGALFFKQIRNEALLLISLFTGGLGLERLIKNTVSQMADLGFTAANMEMAPEKIQAWQMAAEKAGGTAEGIANSLARASQETISFAHEGGAAVSEMLAGAHVGDLSFFSLGGQFDPEKFKNDTEGWMLEKSRILKIAADKYGKADALALAKMWGETEGSFNFLVQGTDAVKSQIEAMKENAKRNVEATQKAQGLRQELSKMGDEFRSISDDIVLALIPALKFLIEKFKEFGDWISTHKDDLVVMFNKWSAEIKPFIDQIDKLAQKMGGWQNILLGLIAIRFLPMITNIGLLAAGLFRVATGITAIGAAAGGGGFLGLTKFLGALALLFYPKELGTGEEEEIKKNEEALKKNPKVFNQNAYKTENGDRILAMLQAKGMSKEESLGIMANWYEESLFNPNAKQIGGGPGRGIAQWEKARQKVFEERYHKSLEGSSLEEQIDFALYEIREGQERKNWERARAESGGTASGFARGYSKYVERPKEIERDSANRAIVADQLNKLYSSKNAQNYMQNMRTPMAIANGALSKTANATTNNTSTNDVKINNININTQATDAKGIAQAIKPAMTGMLYNNFNTGMQA
jgi:hypothetical protein